MTPEVQDPERRRAPRMKIFQPAEMAWAAGEAARVHLLNLSTGGALAYGAATPQVGDEVRIDCGIALGAARVAWRDGRRFGLAFAEPIAASKVDAVLQLQEAMIVSASARLGLPCGLLVDSD